MREPDSCSKLSKAAIPLVVCTSAFQIRVRVDDAVCGCDARQKIKTLSELAVARLTLSHKQNTKFVQGVEHKHIRMSRNHRFTQFITLKCMYCNEGGLTLDKLDTHLTLCEFGPGGGFGMIYPLENGMFYFNYIDENGYTRHCGHPRLGPVCTGHSYPSGYTHPLSQPWSLLTDR